MLLSFFLFPRHFRSRKIRNQQTNYGGLPSLSDFSFDAEVLTWKIIILKEVIYNSTGNIVGLRVLAFVGALEEIS